MTTTDRTFVNLEQIIAALNAVSAEAGNLFYLRLTAAATDRWKSLPGPKTEVKLDRAYLATEGDWVHTINEMVAVANLTPDPVKLIDNQEYAPLLGAALVLRMA